MRNPHAGRVGTPTTERQNSDPHHGTWLQPRRASDKARVEVGPLERNGSRTGMKDDAAERLWPTSLPTRADKRGFSPIRRSN